MTGRTLGTASEAMDALGLPDLAAVWSLVAEGRLDATRDDETQPWTFHREDRTMTEPTPDPAPPILDNTLPGEPTAPEPPPEYDPDLMPYATWRQDEDMGRRRAHDDARLEPADRMDPEAVAAEGPAFLNGYNRHTTDLRDAGVIR